MLSFSLHLLQNHHQGVWCWPHVVKHVVLSYGKIVTTFHSPRVHGQWSRYDLLTNKKPAFDTIVEYYWKFTRNVLLISMHMFTGLTNTSTVLSFGPYYQSGAPNARDDFLNYSKPVNWIVLLDMPWLFQGQSRYGSWNRITLYGI